MLTLLLHAALAAPLPAVLAPTPPALQDRDPKPVHIGSPKPKWTNRKQIAKELAQDGGGKLVEAYRAGVFWLGDQVGEQGVEHDSGRGAGVSALVGLALMGDTSTTNSGRHRAELRKLVQHFRDAQDAESGAFGDREAAGFLVDQALMLHMFSEAYFSDLRPAQEQAARKAAELLLAARGEDGVWHAGGAADPLRTGLAAYALFAARDAGIELDDADFEAVFAWSGKAPAGAGGVDTAALLTARVFCASALQRSLKGDERVGALVELLAASVPAEPAEGEPAPEAPAVASDPLFLYLATLSLYQADIATWSRLNRWLLEQVVPRQVAADEQRGYWEEAATRGVPSGRVATSALIVLSMQNRRRELPVPSLAR